MSGVYKKFGDTLELEIQLGDGALYPTTRVFARIDQLDGTNIVPEFELTNNGDGSYTDTSNTMPTNYQIKVLYFIRESDGVTAETKYNPNYTSELFMRDLIGEVIEDLIGVGTPTAAVIEGSLSPDIGLEGEVIEDLLIGELGADTIIEGETNEC